MSDKQYIKDFSDASETSKFLLSFIQALLKTGYYSTGHPETSKAREGLYHDFVTILKGYNELTFVVATTKNERDILVDGIVDEPTPISSFMLTGMAEMFIPKFLAYFDRKNLSSFSIKEDITRKEFEAFIDIMSESPLREEDSDSQEQLTLKLINQSILHVSTIFNIDLVGKERELPWRVEIALTRLKKDLSLIPLYKNLDEEKISELKNMVFDDIIRPIKSYKIVKDIIINLDIISPYISGISKEEFEERITDYIHKDLLLRAAPDILDFLRFVDESYEKMPDEGILERKTFVKKMAKRVGLKIIGYGFLDEKLFMDFFKYKILDISELPVNLRMKINRRKELELFLKNPQDYFTLLEKAQSPEDVGRNSLVLLNFIPELFEGNLFSEAEEILKHIKKTGFDVSLMDSILLDEIASCVVKKLDETTKEEQMRVLEIAYMMEKPMISVFINVLTHENRIVRKISCEKLIRHGTAVIPAIKNMLEKRKDWYFVRNAVMILAEVSHDAPELAELFKKYLLDQEQRVRVEAMAGLVNTLGTDAEDLFLNALRDKNLLVRKKAVWAIGKITSVKPEAIDYFIDTIKGKQNEDESLMEQVLTSIQIYPPRLEETKKLEQVILEAISKKQGVMGKLSGKYVLSDNIKVRMCDTLASIGSEKSIDILQKLARKGSPLIKTKASDAVKRIKRNVE
jgi:hypothetical protein